jgi:hypothetical protein
MDTEKWSFPVLKAARWAADPDEKFRTEDKGRFEDWVLWVRASALPKDLPLDPNARHPEIDGRVPKAIAKTLRECPAEFVKRNNGICVVARSCFVKDNTATLILNVVGDEEEKEDGRRGDGILNGGHTYAVLRAILKEVEARGESAELTPDGDVRDAVVRVEVQTGLAEEDLAEISRARNLSAAVQEFSLKNLGNSWQPIKKVLSKQTRVRFAFMENDPEAPKAEYDVGDLVKLLALFNSKLYPVGKKDPVAAFTSEKSLITRWKVEDFEHILPRLTELMALHDDVTTLFPKLMGSKPGKFNGVEVAEHKQFQLLGGRPAKYKIPVAFVFPVLSALRVFLKDDGSGWHIMPSEMMGDAGPATVLVQDAVRLYRELGKSSAAFFGRNRQVWEMLSMRAQLLRQYSVK